MCDRDFRFLEIQKFKTSWILFNHLRWSAMAEVAGAGLMQQSGQDLASWKCFSYIYCTRGGKSWLCRTYRAHHIEEDTLLESNRFEGGHTDNTMARRTINSFEIVFLVEGAQIHLVTVYKL